MGTPVKPESTTDKFIYDSLLIGFNDFNIRNYLAKQNPKKWCLSAYRHRCSFREHWCFYERIISTSRRPSITSIYSGLFIFI